MNRFCKAPKGARISGTKPAALVAAALFFCLLITLQGRPPALEPNLRTELPPDGSDLLLSIEAKNRADAMAHFSIGLAHQLNNRADQALESFYKACMLDPSHEELVLDVARRLVQKRDLERASRLLDKAAALPSAGVEIHMILGFVSGLRGDNEKAVEANLKAMEIAPDELLPYQNLVRAYLERENPGQILTLIDSLLSQHSDNAAFLTSFVHSMLELPASSRDRVEGLDKSLTKVLERAEKASPKPEVMEMIAFSYRRLGELEEAIAIYRRLLEEKPDVPSIKVRLAEALFQKEEFAEAAKYFREYLVDRPNNVQIYITLAQVYIRMQEYEKAEEQYERAILFKEDFEGVYYELARLRTYIGKADQALEVVEKARNRFKSSFMMEYCSALAWRQKEDYSKALEFYTKAELVAKTSNNQDQLDYEFYHEVGSAHERNQDFELAEKYFRKGLELNPDHAETQNYLGYMWAERGEKLEEAKELIAKAVKQQPENAAFLDSMAWVLYQLGEVKEALPYQLKAMKLINEPDAVLFEHLGDIYFKLDNREKASEFWKKANDIEPSEALSGKLEKLGTGKAEKKKDGSED